MNVLDASALLAFLLDEPGSDAVEEALAAGASMSAVNLSEVLTKLADIGLDPEAEAGSLEEMGLLGIAVDVEAFDRELALEAAKLRRSTKGHGLSLGDRACIALGRLRGATVLTAERTWERVPDLGVIINRVR